MFQKISEAYDVLSDKKKRAIYDRFGYNGLHDGVSDANGEFEEGYTYKMNGQEIFEKFFGTDNPFANFGFEETSPFIERLKKAAPRKAEPIIHDLLCTLEELFNGCRKGIKLTRKRFNSENELEDQTKEIYIQVKQGWKDGTKIIFPNEGDEFPGTVPSDIVFIIREVKHFCYSREENHLIFTAHLSLTDALTDCILEVPTLDNRTLSIPCPEVVSPGYEKRIPKEGMPISKYPDLRGDLIIRFKLIFPNYLCDEKKRKIRQIFAGEIEMGN